MTSNKLSNLFLIGHVDLFVNAYILIGLYENKFTKKIQKGVATHCNPFSLKYFFSLPFIGKENECSFIRLDGLYIPIHPWILFYKLYLIVIASEYIG